ncbi:hypothetical protein [Aneurinibacillus migulanus]|uniref:hypothetical protein n=1 Tax=Aneurinibacillus migulanus TaxID=47500 RepID=UPI000A85E096|nr:hypothetical protein [Aneurinibacillus migulanus]MCP1357038.1 hypothetical protein [Aneurinibacillus migulanus]
MMKKKLYATLLGTGVALATMSSVFAAEPSTEQQVNESATVQAHGWHKGGKMTESKLEELAKEKGITVDELKQQLQKEREAKLEELAKEKGITVNELKQQMKQKKEAKLEQMAKKKGITVDELKQQLQKKHEEKLEEIAKQKGISVDELKKQLPNGGQL